MVYDFFQELGLTAMISTTFVVLYGLHYSQKRMVHASMNVHKRIYHGQSDLNRFIEKRMENVVASYRPTWWTNAHIQIFLTFLVPQSKIFYTRELFSLQDGGQLALDWAQEQKKHRLNEESSILIILHGLTGCSESMKSICAEALEHGYRPVVFNKRGHGGVELTTPTMQAFGCIQDLTEAIDHCEQKYPKAQLYGLGFSAGSGLLCSYLGEKAHQSKLQAGVLISPGFDAHKLFCHGGIHPVYDFLMTFSLKKLVWRHKKILSNVIDMQKAMKAKSVCEFDRQVSMKMHGYENLEDYWKKNNPMRDVFNIKRPLLCLNALDDPVCTKEQIPYQEIAQMNHVMLIETGSGSHCAFYQGHLKLKSWAPEVAMTYLDSVREYQTQTKKNKISSSPSTQALSA